MTLRPWRTLSRRTLLARPPWLEVGDETVELPDGRVIEGFHWLAMRDFVNIIALTSRGEVVCERSYKHGPRAVTLQFPAGYIENGEDPLTAAKRELREETGYEALAWISLGVFTLDGNYGGNRMHAFLALDASSVAAPHAGDLEEIEVFTAPLDDAVQWVRGGEVKLLSSAAALALACLELAGGEVR